MRMFIFCSILFFVLILNGCALKDMMNIYDNQDELRAPVWDLEFSADILERGENMGDYFEVPDIAPISITPFPWPPALTYDLITDLGANLTTDPVSIDFDGEPPENDFSLTKIRSNEGKGFIQVSISSSGSTIENGDFEVNTIEIDGITYNFGSPVIIDGKFIATTTDFLAAAGAEHDLGGDGKVDFDSFPFIVNQGPPAKSGNITISLTMSFGDVFTLIGDVPLDIKLYSVADQDVPITNSQMTIDEFSIDMDINNNMPFALLMNSFFSDGNVNYPLIDKIGNTSDITVSLGEKKIALTTEENIFQKGELTMSVDLYIPAGSVELRNDMSIWFKLGVSGKGQVSLDIF